MGHHFARVCDVGITCCLFEAIWNWHMWENLVSHAHTFLIGNVTDDFQLSSIPKWQLRVLDNKCLNCNVIPLCCHASF